MSTIDELETIFVEAVLTNLVVDVEIHKNFLRVYLRNTSQLDDTIRKLTIHIIKAFPQVKYFDINKNTCVMDIYHYKEFEEEKRKKAIEEKL